MEIQYLPVGGVFPYEKNPRDNSKAVEMVARSLREYGWKQPIVVDKDHVIICGHTRWKAAQMNGESEVPCIVASDLTPEQVRAYRLADNKVSDFSIWDNKLLLEELEGLDGLDLFTGFDESDLFDNVLDENDRDAVLENDVGIVYEIVFKSEDKSKIDKIIAEWEKIAESEETDED